MSKRINIRPGASAGRGFGLPPMTAAGNPWTVEDGVADELVNRQVADREFSVDERPMSVYGVSDWGDLWRAVSQIAQGDRALLRFDKDIVLESPLPDDVETSRGVLDLNWHSLIGGNIDRDWKAIRATFNPDPADFNGYKRYDFARPWLMNGRILGPGLGDISTWAAKKINEGKGNSAVYFDGILDPVANRTIRPTMKHVIISGWNHCIDGRKGFFLGRFDRCIAYDSDVAVRQRRGIDAGELCIFEGLIQRVRLGYLLEDSSSEWHHIGSMDYVIQGARLAPGTNGWARLTFSPATHEESRGGENGDDPGWYVSNGTGSDARCIDPIFDSFFDVAGNAGSGIFFNTGASLDNNTNGVLNPPNTDPTWEYDHMIHLREKNTWAVLDSVSPQSLAGKWHVLKRGPGVLKTNIVAPAFPSNLTLPARKSDHPNDCLAVSPQIANLSADLWTITHDGKEITDRHTGLNLLLERDTAIQPGGQGDGTIGAISVGVDPGTILYDVCEAIAPIAGNSCVLKDPWPAATGTYTATFSSGATRSVTLTLNSTAASWSGGGVVADARFDVKSAGTTAADGAYRLVFRDATTFVLQRPNYEQIGVGTVGTQFNGGGLSFLVTAGATPFASYDSVTITVASGAATASGAGVTFAAALTAAASGTLVSAWSRTTGTYDIKFSDGSFRRVSFTNGSTAATWTGAVTATASATIHGIPLKANACLKVTKTAQTALTFTAAIAAASSATLAAAWAGATGVYAVTFSDSSVRSATLTNGSTAVTWTGGNVTATANATIRNDAKFSMVVDIDKGKLFTAEVLTYLSSSDGPTGPVAIAYRFVKKGVPKVVALTSSASDGSLRAGHSQVVPSFGAPDTGASGGFDLGFSRSAADVRSVTLDASAGNLDKWVPYRLTIGNASSATGEMVVPEWADAVQIIGVMDNAGSGALRLSWVQPFAW
tara:strand:- start:649 stop:3474 length:2826 start_codon:yes stop_codon:yes gene_type:complete